MDREFCGNGNFPEDPYGPKAKNGPVPAGIPSLGRSPSGAASPQLLLQQGMGIPALDPWENPQEWPGWEALDPWEKPREWPGWGVLDPWEKPREWLGWGALDPWEKLLGKSLGNSGMESGILGGCR